MDINNTPYFLLRTESEFRNGSRRLHWHADQRCLMLAPNQELRLPTADPVAALAAWQTSSPLAMDRFGQLARIHSSGTYIEYYSGKSYLPLQDSELKLLAAPAGQLRDLALGGDDRLAMPFSNGVSQHGLLLFHLARRWQCHCSLPLPVDRVWIDADNQIWGVAGNQLLRCSGEPLPLPYTPLPDRFEPVATNPHALQTDWQQALPAPWSALAITGDSDALYLLCHDGSGNQAVLRRARRGGAGESWQVFVTDEDVPFAIDLATVAPGRLAALAPRQSGDSEFARRDCAVLELDWDMRTQQGEARLIRERYPMLSQAVPRFVSCADSQLRYQADADPAVPAMSPRPRELHALRRPQYQRDASAWLQQVLDSGQPDTCWHRLYVDACIPPGCSIEFAVRVYNAPAERSEIALPQPALQWNPLPSELPLHGGIVSQKVGESGLFELLLQRPEGPVRRLTGRYLQLQVHLRGNGKQTPSLHAIRVYYPRFSYQDAYLPEWLRQEQVFDPGRSDGPANGADVRERLLALVEGVLTPIEGRVAASEQLLSADAAPVGQLPTLAGLLGSNLPAHWPLPRQRRRLRETALLQQWNGTFAGVQLALDIATDGGISRGEVVLLENFRLRRTMATILGINMDDGEHPLTLGTGMSGNSLIGDSLILSETDAKTFLALFAPDLADADERQIVEQFFLQYAHQISVLLHGRGRQWRQTVEDILNEQMPAHVQWQLIETEHPFVLGLAPLLTIDTFLEHTPAPRRVELDDTWLGREGVLKNLPAFSPRDVNARPDGTGALT